MSALVSFILEYLPVIIGAVGLGGAALWLRKSGKDAAKAEQAAKEKQARDIKDQVDNDIGAMPSDKAREELKSWRKR